MPISHLPETDSPVDRSEEHATPSIEPERSTFRRALLALSAAAALAATSMTVSAEGGQAPQEEKEKQKFAEVEALIKDLNNNKFDKRDTALKALKKLIKNYVQQHEASPPWKELLRPNEKTQDAELHKNLQSLWKILQEEERPLIWTDKAVNGLPKPGSNPRLKDFLEPLQRVAGDRSFVENKHDAAWDVAVDPSCTWKEGQSFWSLVHALRTKDGGRLTTVHDDAGNMTLITTKYNGPVAFNGPIRVELTAKEPDPPVAESIFSKTRMLIGLDSLPQIAVKECHLTSIEVTTKTGRKIPCEIICADATPRSGFVLEIPTLTKGDMPVDVAFSMDSTAVPVSAFTVKNLKQECPITVGGESFTTTILEKEENTYLLRLAVPGLASDFVLHSSCIAKNAKGEKLPRTQTETDGRTHYSGKQNSYQIAQISTSKTGVKAQSRI